MGIVDALLKLSPLTSWQNGLFATAQAQKVGVDTVTVGRLLSRGLTERLGRGVYALNSSTRLRPDLEEIYWRWLHIHPSILPSERANRLESVPVVMGHAAARLHGIGDLYIYEYEFSLPQKRVSRNQSFKFYTRQLPEHETTWCEGMRVTTIERTIADVAKWGECDYRHISQMILDAVESKHVRLDVLAQMLDDEARESSYPVANGKELLDLLLHEAGLDIDSLATRIASNKELVERVASKCGMRNYPSPYESVNDMRAVERVLLAV